MGRKINQKSIKIEAEIECVPGSIFGGIFMDLIAYGNLPHRALGKLSNMVPKIFKKSTKTGVPHRPRKLKKQPKMGYPIGPGRLRRLLGSLGESWARFGGILGRLGCILGPSWAILGRTSGQHGSNLGAKMELKWAKNRSKNRSKF